MRRLVSLLGLFVACTTPPPSSTLSPLMEATTTTGVPLDVSDIPVIDLNSLKSSVPVSRRVLIIGDSEACAVRPYVKETIRKVNETAGVPTDSVDVDCKGGTVVQYWGAQGHFREALRRHPKPDTVLVFLGTNHYGQTVTPPVDQILDIIKENNMSCVWVGNTAVKGKHWRINKLLKAAVQPTCSYFDTEAAEIPLPDGVHPSGAGAIKWLKAIWPLIPPKYEESND